MSAECSIFIYFFQLQAEVATQSSELGSLRSQITQLQSTNESLRADNTNLKSKSSSEAEQLSQRLSGQEGKVNDLQEELSTLQRHYDEQCQVNDDLKSQVHDVKNSLEEANRNSLQK